jgi:gas vesicle protein
MIFNIFKKSKNKLANEINLMAENAKVANENLYNMSRQTKELEESLKDFKDIIAEYTKLFRIVNEMQKEKCYNNNINDNNIKRTNNISSP